QLPVLALEQRIKAELEINPLLEEIDEVETIQEQEDVTPAEGEQVETKNSEDDRYTFEDFMNDELDGHKASRKNYDDEEREEIPQPAELTITQKLIDQIFFLDISPEEKILSEEIVGNIDEDGYLRRELPLIVQDLNLAQQLSITNDRAEEILAMIQRLDPPGIAARS